MTNYEIFYDLNVLEPDSWISYELGIKIEISTATTDLWKDIHKKALIGDKEKVNKDLKNGTTYNHPSNVATNLMKIFELTLTTKFISKSGAFYLLDVLPSDSDSKTVCDYIHISLILNQL